MSESQDHPIDSVDLTGQSLGGYSILRRLGRGGMADVYLARQESLQRNVALKVLKPELAKDDSYIQRFEREAQSAAKLVQSNIVGVYEVGETNGLHFIAQEYIVGRNLREYLARNGAVKPIMAVNIIRQVALALQKAESHGVTHRDIKPENIMLSPAGEVKVADFGLARVNDSTDKHLTQVGITMGTPLYMSPEQVEGEDVDVRSDIYSLGVTAYHMLAGHPPFDGENALAIAVQHINATPESLRDMRPDASDELIRVIERMMSKSPADRQQNAAQLIKEIKNVKVELDEDWEQLVETLAIASSTTTESRTLSESRLAATRQLQSVMQGNVRSWWTELSTVLGFLLLAATGTFVGLWTSNQFQPTDPLGVVTENSEVPIQPTAKAQYELAVKYHSRKLNFFQAVLDFHPIDSAANPQQTEMYRFKSMERLGELYLITKQFDQAKQIYAGLVESEYTTRITTIGHAGLAIVYHTDGQREFAEKEIESVGSSAEAYLNEFMLGRFEKVRHEILDESQTIASF